MSQNKFNFSEWSLLRQISFSISMLLLAVSMYHAGSFMWNTSEPGFQRWAMMVTVFGLLTASHCYAYKFGIAIGAGFSGLAAGAVMLIIPLETVSIYTSAASLNSRVISAVRRENQNSPEYVNAMRSVDNIQRQIEAYQENVANMSNNYATKRRQMNGDIANLQDRLMMAQDRAANVDVSSTKKAYTAIQDLTGISSSMIYYTVAFMLTLVPMFNAIFWAIIGGGFGRYVNTETDTGTRIGEALARKKSQRQPLKAA